MVTTQFIQKLELALHYPLPGEDAQAKMAPEGRRPGEKFSVIQPDHREAAVLLMLYPVQDAGLHFALIQRQTYKGVHSGQIAFPGGSREAGELFRATALRETFEEIGVPSVNIDILGALSPLYIPPSNFMVYPFVGYYPFHPKFKAQMREVAGIIQIPVSALLNAGIEASETRNHSLLGQVEIPYYNLGGYKIWGATAMILSEFIQIISETN